MDKNARETWIRHFIFDFLTKINSYRTMVTTIMDEMVYTELSSMKREEPVRLDRHTMVSEYLETADEDIIFKRLPVHPSWMVITPFTFWQPMHLP